MIDYTKIAAAISYYKGIGYTEIDMPWIASKEAISITLPKGLEAMQCQIGLLIGSAEQKFIEMAINKKIFGKYISTTPCFRVEPVIDELHHNFFMKVELFINDKVDKESLNNVIGDAFSFYNKYLPVEIIKTPDGYDIVDRKNKIELGSYGIRNNPLVGSWLYGTGLAEPRLSYVMGKK